MVSLRNYHLLHRPSHELPSTCFASQSPVILRKRPRETAPFLSLTFSSYLSFLSVPFASISLSRIPVISACKRKDEMANQAEHQQAAPKKPRLVFTDLQRRTLQAIFKVSSARARAHTHVRTCTYIHVHTARNFLPLVIDSNCPLLLRLLGDMHRQLNIERVTTAAV